MITSRGRRSVTTTDPGADRREAPKSVTPEPTQVATESRGLRSVPDTGPDLGGEQTAPVDPRGEHGLGPAQPATGHALSSLKSLSLLPTRHRGVERVIAGVLQMVVRSSCSE
jgi:hypothetical protein